jgi:hypothetical protein
MTLHASRLATQFNLSFAPAMVDTEVRFNWPSFLEERTLIYNRLAEENAEILGICSRSTYLHVSALAVQARIDANHQARLQYKAPTQNRPPPMVFPNGIDRHLFDYLNLIGQYELPTFGLVSTMARLPPVPRNAQPADIEAYNRDVANGYGYPWAASSLQIQADRANRQTYILGRMLNRLANRNTVHNLVGDSVADFEPDTDNQFSARLTAVNNWESYVTDVAFNQQQIQAAQLEAVNTLTPLNNGPPTQAMVQQFLQSQVMQTAYPLRPLPAVAPANPGETRAQVLAAYVTSLAEHGHVQRHYVDTQAYQVANESNVGLNLYWDQIMFKEYDSLIYRFGTFLGRINFKQDMLGMHQRSGHLPFLKISPGVSYGSVKVISPVTSVSASEMATAIIHRPFLPKEELASLYIFETGELRGAEIHRLALVETYVTISPTPKANVLMPAIDGHDSAPPRSRPKLLPPPPMVPLPSQAPAPPPSVPPPAVTDGKVQPPTSQVSSTTNNSKYSSGKSGTHKFKKKHN